MRRRQCWLALASSLVLRFGLPYTSFTMFKPCAALRESSPSLYRDMRVPSQDGHPIFVRAASVPSSTLPPILFIHGAFHSSWCWEENYIPFFLDKGYNCYAISLRGTSDTGLPPESKSKTIKISEHIADVGCVLQHISISQNNNKVIIVAHSFGGLITMKLLENSALRSLVDTSVLLCSLPPSGNGPMSGRFMRRNFFSALKIVYAFVSKAVVRNKNICRKFFFGNEDSLPDADLLRWMNLYIIAICALG